MLGKMTAPWGIAMFWRRRAFPADIATLYSQFSFKQLTLDCEGSTAAGFTCSRAIYECKLALLPVGGTCIEIPEA